MRKDGERLQPPSQALPQALPQPPSQALPQATQTFYARVILDIPTRALEGAFYYEIPAALYKTAQPGCCVLVDFAHRAAIGYLVEITSVLAGGVDADAIKPIQAVLSEPYFDEISARLAQWIAREYLAPLSEAIRLFTPPGSTPRLMRDEDGNWQLMRPDTSAVDDRWVRLTEAGRDYTPPANAVKQRAIIEALRIGEMRVAELAIDISNFATALKALEKRGVVAIELRRRYRGVAAPTSTASPAAASVSATPAASPLAAPASAVSAAPKSISYAYYAADFVLNADQQHALDVICAAVASVASSTNPAAASPAPAVPAPANLAVSTASATSVSNPAVPAPVSEQRASVFLIDGVTGSGKTEVYLRAIQAVLKRGGSALVLVPEISLTPQTVARFRSRFGDMVAVLHSRLSAGERYDQWDRIRLGNARVVVGARSALFAPLPNLKLVIIDEEHEGSYKQSSSPRYVTRDVAQKLVEMRGAVLVLGSATPSFETLFRCETAGMRLVLPTRATGKPLPPIQVVNLSAEFRTGNKSMYSLVLREALSRVVERREKAVILLNKRGFASFLLCRDCGYVPMCENCATSLTYHAHPPRLLCHHCNATRQVPGVCPECGSRYFKELGPGTQFAEEQLASFLPPDTPIIRMDADTTRGKEGHEKCLDAFIAAEYGVLLGTQMIAKGLDFPEVTLVGVLIADTTLKLPDFRAAERSFQLLEQVAGRAGRAEKDGRVIVQTYWPEHIAIRAAASHNRELLFEQERLVRSELGYSPYGRLADILLWGKNAQQVQEQTLIAADALRAVLPENWQLLGPSPCLLSKRQGDYRWHLLLKAPAGADIAGIIGPALRAHKPAEGIRLAIDIDPYDIL